MEFFRRIGDQPLDINDIVHYDPSGSGILARISKSALEEIPKHRLIALAVQGEAKLMRRGSKADAIVALVAAAKKAWSCEKVLDTRKPEG